MIDQRLTRTMSILLICLILIPVRPATSANAIWRSVTGPISARMVRIIDGDTLVVDAHPWPGQTVRVSVRVRGIDTPERRSRCAAERAAADQAKRELEQLISGTPILTLINISGGKYYGRVLADLKAGERDVATAMLETGFASPYKGGKRKKAKCANTSGQNISY